MKYENVCSNCFYYDPPDVPFTKWELSENHEEITESIGKCVKFKRYRKPRQTCVAWRPFDDDWSPSPKVGLIVATVATIFTLLCFYFFE